MLYCSVKSAHALSALKQVIFFGICCSQVKISKYLSTFYSWTNLRDKYAFHGNQILVFPTLIFVINNKVLFPVSCTISTAQYFWDSKYLNETATQRRDRHFCKKFYFSSIRVWYKLFVSKLLKLTFLLFPFQRLKTFSLNRFMPVWRNIACFFHMNVLLYCFLRTLWQ